MVETKRKTADADDARRILPVKDPLIAVPAPAFPIKTASLATQVYDELRRQITEGRLAEDEPLVIARIVRQFGVSQTPVREALARLHAEGLAAFASNFGYRVASFPTDADYENWMEARLIVEVNSLRRAAANATRQQVRMLQTINDKISRTEFDGSFESVRLFSELNAAFHRELILIAGNPFLIKAYDQIWLGSQFSRVRYNRRARDQSKIASEHQAVIDAVRSHNVEDACAALRAHIVDSLGRDKERDP